LNSLDIFKERHLSHIAADMPDKAASLPACPGETPHR